MWEPGSEPGLTPALGNPTIAVAGPRPSGDTAPQMACWLPGDTEEEGKPRHVGTADERGHSGGQQPAPWPCPLAGAPAPGPARGEPRLRNVLQDEPPLSRRSRSQQAEDGRGVAPGWRKQGTRGLQVRAGVGWARGCSAVSWAAGNPGQPDDGITGPESGDRHGEEGASVLWRHTKTRGPQCCGQLGTNKHCCGAPGSGQRAQPPHSVN